MKKDGKVFLLISFGIYKEISYSELLRMCADDDDYRSKKFYPFDGVLMEVSIEDYKEFYKADRRQKYLMEESVLHNEVSFNALDSEEMNGEERIIDPNANVEEAAELATMIEQLYMCLDLLSKDEFKLIYALYFEKKTEREWSAITGLPQKTINDRKWSILRKIKKLMEN
jgi:hypothetical protein